MRKTTVCWNVWKKSKTIYLGNAKQVVIVFKQKGKKMNNVLRADNNQGYAYTTHERRYFSMHYMRYMKYEI